MSYHYTLTIGNMEDKEWNVSSSALNFITRKLIQVQGRKETNKICVEIGGSEKQGVSAVTIQR